MNSVEQIGNLVREPYYKEYPSGEDVVKVAKYTIAVPRKNKDKGADFVSCTAFGGNAVYASKYMEKGDLIAVEGTLHSSAYTDKNGERHFDMTVYVERHQNYTSRKNNELLENAEKNEKKINDAIDSLEGSYMDGPIPEYEFEDYEENPFE